MIAILIPVLARPANAAKVVASIQAATTVRHRVVFVCSPDDAEQRRACEATAATVLVAAWDPGPGDYAKKIQLGFDLTAEPFVFTGADDLDFQPGWDTAALAAIETGGYGVCGTNDGGNPAVKAGRHSTHSLIRRAYIDVCGGTFDEQPGVILHDGYDHQSVELELLEVARSRGCYVHAHDSLVIHRHPFWDRTVPRDATYEKGLARGREDSRLFMARRKAWRARSSVFAA